MVPLGQRKGKGTCKGTGTGKRMVSGLQMNAMQRKVSQGKPSQADPSETNPSHATPRSVKPSQAQRKHHQAEPIRTQPNPDPTQPNHTIHFLTIVIPYKNCRELEQKRRSNFHVTRGIPRTSTFADEPKEANRHRKSSWKNCHT